MKLLLVARAFEVAVSTIGSWWSCLWCDCGFHTVGELPVSLPPSFFWNHVRFEGPFMLLIQSFWTTIAVCHCMLVCKLRYGFEFGYILWVFWKYVYGFSLFFFKWRVWKNSNVFYFLRDETGKYILNSIEIQSKDQFNLNYETGIANFISKLYVSSYTKNKNPP